MDHLLYQFETKVSYGRNPIKIQSAVKYDTLENIKEDSPLINQNKFTVTSGKQWYDFLPFSDSFFFAISKRVKEIFEANNITGLAYFPILIENTDKEYFGFYITSYAGKILNLDEITSYETDKHEFDHQTWDGSEIFTLQETLLCICKQKVKDLLEKYKVTNVEVKPF